MKQIPLRKKDGNIYGYTQVDDADYDYLMQFRWAANWTRASHQPISGWWRPRDGVKKTKQQIHRVIMGVVGEGSKVQVDHIDGNPWNNQRSNLRLVTQQENLTNRKIIQKSTAQTGSVFRGVRKEGPNFWGYAMLEGEVHKVGPYKDELEAAKNLAFVRVQKSSSPSPRDIVFLGDWEYTEPHTFAIYNQRKALWTVGNYGFYATEEEANYCRKNEINLNKKRKREWLEAKKAATEHLAQLKKEHKEAVKTQEREARNQLRLSRVSRYREVVWDSTAFRAAYNGEIVGHYDTQEEAFAAREAFKAEKVAKERLEIERRREEKEALYRQELKKRAELRKARAAEREETRRREDAERKAARKRRKEAARAKASKVCSDCTKEKPCSEFYARPDTHDGLRANCKTCYTSARSSRSK